MHITTRKRVFRYRNRSLFALVHKVMHRLYASAIKSLWFTGTYTQHRRLLFKLSQHSSIYDKKNGSYTQSLHCGKRVAVDYFSIRKSLKINGLFGLVFD